jgi:hypothetical protein
MDSHPKVMTVSYGTFSCTLDGFDDPFTTMQLVAEYFRKLSADDRYFGSEPLQPDASKLHQIARDANPNRIDAEVSENSVILRQADVIDATTKEQPAQVEMEDKAPETAPEKEIVEVTQEVTAAQSEDEEAKAAFSSRRKTATAEELATDKIIASLEENITDTTTADELAPALDEEIPSETVSAAIKALKGGEAIDRWLETTNEKMAMPEHVSKANALERLKAAVAATEAERTTRMENVTADVVVETGEERRDNTISFRRELAKVRKAYETETSNVFFRPKTRKSNGRNGVSRPLVLDMGQRIKRRDQDVEVAQTEDVKKKSSLTLVSEQPKQTHKPKVTVKHKRKQELPSFDTFAKMMGASTLIELLEASAAYMTLVLGEKRYSEAQISANLPEHIKNIVKDEECTSTLDRLNKRGFIDTSKGGTYTISMARKAAYQKKYLAG